MSVTVTGLVWAAAGTSSVVVGAVGPVTPASYLIVRVVCTGPALPALSTAKYLTVQPFGGRKNCGTRDTEPLRSCGELVVGSGAQQLVTARGWGEAREAWPSAANAMKLDERLRTLPPKPVYARAPDAKAKEAA